MNSGLCLIPPAWCGCRNPRLFIMWEKAGDGQRPSLFTATEYLTATRCYFCELELFTNRDKLNQAEPSRAEPSQAANGLSLRRLETRSCFILKGFIPNSSILSTAFTDMHCCHYYRLLIQAVNCLYLTWEEVLFQVSVLYLSQRQLLTFPPDILTQISELSPPHFHNRLLTSVWGELWVVFICRFRTLPSQHHKTDFNHHHVEKQSRKNP